MSFNKFIEDLEKLEEISYSNMSVINITKLVIPEKEILKKILIERSPELSEEDIDIIADSVLGEDEETSEDDVQEDDEETSEDDVIERARKKRRKAIKEERRREKEELKKIYKSRSGNLKEETKELKNKIISAVFQFLNKFKEVTKSFVLALIKVITSIPGAVTMAVAPPWNIPGAVTSLLVVVNAYLGVLSNIRDLVPFLKPLKSLPNIIDKSKINGLGSSLDAITLILIELYKPILGFNNFIKKIIEFIKSLFGNKKSQRVFKQATKKLIKLGHIESLTKKPRLIVEKDEAKLRLRNKGNQILDDDGQRFNIDSLEEGEEIPVNIFSYDSDDVDEIVSILNQFKITNSRKWGGKQHVSGYRRKGEFDAILKEVESLEKELDGKDAIFSELDITDTDEFEQFVYDITLPDGTVVPNISTDGLEYYRNKFELIFNEV